MKYIYLLLYYCFAFYLPDSDNVYLGKLAKKIRYNICRHIFLSCGYNVNIQKKVKFGKGDKLVIGSNSGIGLNSSIANGTIIGDNVMIAPCCVIFNKNHEFSRKDIPMRLQGNSTIRNVIIKDDVWIGHSVLIMPGRTISRGTIVAAGCVVCKDFPPFSVIGGNPSSLIKKR